MVKACNLGPRDAHDLGHENPTKKSTGLGFKV